jgi:hypothetical protein
MPNANIPCDGYPALALSDDPHSLVISFDVRKVVFTAVQDNDELPILKGLRLDGRDAFTKKSSATKAGDHYTHIRNAHPHQRYWPGRGTVGDWTASGTRGAKTPGEICVMVETTADVSTCGYLRVLCRRPTATSEPGPRSRPKWCRGRSWPSVPGRGHQSGEPARPARRVDHPTRLSYSRALGIDVTSFLSAHNGALLPDSHAPICSPRTIRFPSGFEFKAKMR